MERIDKNQIHIIEKMYVGWDETLIWSCLQGCMGEAWVDCVGYPTASAIVIGDFCFVAGVAREKLLEELSKVYAQRTLLVVPQSVAWEKVIEKVYGIDATKIKRYATKKEGDTFDRKRLLKNIENLKAYKLVKIDEALYHQILKEAWCQDLCSQFRDAKDYEKRGLGYVVLDGDKIVSGASSYTVYNEGLEIEIDTHPDYRRQGLALACGSQLILACLEKNLYPSWDAANKASIQLAQKLGYVLDKEYITYEVRLNEPFKAQFKSI